MSMETTPLLPITAEVPLLDDEALVELFAASGLSVDVLATCSDASCPVCFGPASVRAA